MVKTKIKWTNHRDPKKNGSEDQVDAARAKVLARDGLAVVVADDDGVDRSPDVARVNVTDPGALPAGVPSAEPVADDSAGKPGVKGRK